MKNGESDIFKDENGRYVLRIMVEGETRDVVLAAEDYVEACAHADAAIREIRMYHMVPGIA
jgi:hypothetical protein